MCMCVYVFRYLYIHTDRISILYSSEIITLGIYIYVYIYATIASTIHSRLHLHLDLHLHSHLQLYLYLYSIALHTCIHACMRTCIHTCAMPYSAIYRPACPIQGLHLCLNIDLPVQFRACIYASGRFFCRPAAHSRCRSQKLGASAFSRGALPAFGQREECLFEGKIAACVIRACSRLGPSRGPIVKTTLSGGVVTRTGWRDGALNRPLFSFILR